VPLSKSLDNILSLFIYGIRHPSGDIACDTDFVHAIFTSNHMFSMIIELYSTTSANLWLINVRGVAMKWTAEWCPLHFCQRRSFLNRCRSGKFSESSMLPPYTLIPKWPAVYLPQFHFPSPVCAWEEWPIPTLIPARFCLLSTTLLGDRPFLEQFALCYRTVVLQSVCLSSLRNVGASWPNGSMDGSRCHLIRR